MARDDLEFPEIRDFVLGSCQDMASTLAVRRAKMKELWDEAEVICESLKDE